VLRYVTILSEISNFGQNSWEIFGVSHSSAVMDETKISSMWSQVTPMDKLNEMVQYFMLAGDPLDFEVI
jgi:hypothetical protein